MHAEKIWYTFYNKTVLGEWKSVKVPSYLKFVDFLISIV